MIDPKVKTLLALVEIGNYTKTAQHLSLTQPAVSHHIRQIEEEYEIKIFHSGKKTLSLTPEGEVLVKYAKRLMAIEQKLTHALKTVRTLFVGTMLAQQRQSVNMWYHSSLSPTAVSIRVLTSTLSLTI